MVDERQEVTQTSSQDGDYVHRTTEVSRPKDEASNTQTLARNIVWYIAGVIEVLLGFRFLLALLGANSTNTFANIIYTLSRPFVAPFFSLFSYRGYVYGVSRFEVYTLVAMLFYLVVAWGIAKLVTLNRE